MQESDRRKRAWAVFDQLVDLPPQQRSARLQAEDIGPDIRRQVQALLEDYDRDEQATAPAEAPPVTQ